VAVFHGVYVPINALENRTSNKSFTKTMLALKKKREAEQKQAAAAIQAEASSSHTQESATNDGKDNVHASTVAGSTDHNGESTKIGTDTLQSVTTATNTTSQTTSSSKVSLLGIGGIKKNNASSTTNANNSKKRTPGEIRIQKGKLCWIENVVFVCSSNASFLKSVSFVIVSCIVIVLDFLFTHIYIYVYNAMLLQI
jgi:hypothetical protein